MTYYARGRKMWRYPSNRTIKRLRDQGYRRIVWDNGDFLLI